MDRNSLPMFGGSQDLIGLSEAKIHDSIPGIGSLGYNAELNGATQNGTGKNGTGKNGVEDDSPKPHESEDVMTQHAVQQNGFEDSDNQHGDVQNHSDQEQGVQHDRNDHDSKGESAVDNAASAPSLPAIDSTVRERLRISLERNMPDMAEMCFNTMSDEYRPPQPPMGYSVRNGGGGLDTAADDAYVIPNRRPRLFVPFHVMEAVYGKPVPMQSYDHHAAMLPLSRDMPPFMPVRPYTPTTPAQHQQRRRRRPSRRTGSPTKRTLRPSDGADNHQARSLEESPGRKFSAMLGRCVAAMAALGTADLLAAHGKFTEELERRGVSIIGPGTGGDKAAGRVVGGRSPTSCQSNPDHGPAKLNGSSECEAASTKTDDPFTE